MVSMTDWIVRNWAAVAIIVTCLSVVGGCTYLLTYYVRIVLNIFVDTPPPLSMGPVDFQRLEGEKVRFRSFDGTSLQGMWYEPPRTVGYKGAIVFCHEYGSDMYSCARYTRPLLESGYGIFTFDFRAHGESSGGDYKPLQWPSDRELGDVLGATAHVESMLREAGRPAMLGLFGISRGAGSGLLAAASDPNVKAIVCDGAFDTQKTVIALMKRWAKIFASIRLIYENHPEGFWKFLLWVVMRFAQPKLHRRFPSVLNALRDMEPRPILFIHGQRDSYIRVEQTEILHATAPEPKYLWIVEKAKHNQAAVLEPDAYAARTVAFFDRHLAGLDVNEAIITGRDASAVVA